MLAYLLIALGFFLRLVPHAPNAVPVAAIALFAGSYLDKRVVPWVPLAIMIISDLIIGLHDVVFFTWGAFALIGFMGIFLKKHRTPAAIFGATVFSSFIFYIISNFGVFLAWYPHTFDGFVTCYVKALPFLRNTMAVNIVFSFILFGTYELARRMVENSRLRYVLLTD